MSAADRSTRLERYRLLCVRLERRFGVEFRAPAEREFERLGRMKLLIPVLERFEMMVPSTAVQAAHGVTLLTVRLMAHETYKLRPGSLLAPFGYRVIAVGAPRGADGWESAVGVDGTPSLGADRDLFCFDHNNVDDRGEPAVVRFRGGDERFDPHMTARTAERIARPAAKDFDAFLKMICPDEARASA